MNANNAPRCTAVVRLADGSTADCMRHRKVGTLCRQHAGMSDPNEYKVLDARERDTLAELARGPMPYAVGRNMPEAYRALIAQGLAFRSHTGLTITDKGREVSERVS